MKILSALLFTTFLATAAQAQQISGNSVVSGDTPLTATLSLTATNNLPIPVPAGSGTLRFSISSVTGSGAAIVVQGLTVSGAWSGNLTIYTSNTVPAGTSVSQDISGDWVQVYGFTSVRFVVGAIGTGTATINANLSAQPPLASIVPTGNVVAAVHVSGTTSATAGVSSTVVAAAGVTKGIVLQNTCGTAEWFSSSVAAGTALTAINSMTLAPGASFPTPDWYPVSGAWTIASATAVACTYVADYK